MQLELNILKYRIINSSKLKLSTGIGCLLTLYRNDSTIIREKGDTVFLERYKYIYKVKELKYTVNVTDTITVVKPIEVIKEVNRLRNWQVGLMVLGGAAIALVGYKLIKFIKI